MGNINLFDIPVNRHQTNSIKWDYPGLFSEGKDVIPLWIAEMDFKVPANIQKSITKRISVPNYGYAWKSPEYFKAVSNWCSKFNWDVSCNWITTTPSVMNAIALAIMTFTSPGDVIITDTPIYPPIYQCIKNLNRKILFNNLILRNNRYYRDIKHLQKRITKNTKMYIICNPHNPTGTVWTEDELNKVAKFCINNNLLIISDDIYADLTFERKHKFIASLNSQIFSRTITCVSASKTYCIAGLQMASVIISNKILRNKFIEKKEYYHLSLPNVFGPVATIAAYEECNNWLKKLVIYLKINRDEALNYIGKNIEIIKAIKPEGTFLLWINCKSLNLSTKELCGYLSTSAQIQVSDGNKFGPGGNGFIRMNIGLPRKVLYSVLERLATSINKLVEMSSIGKGK